MSFQSVAVLIFIGICLGCVGGHPERPPILDAGLARQLFRNVDRNSTHPDGRLDRANVDQLFEQFDVDGDGQVTREEFQTEWTRRKLGSVVNANIMFQRLDTDRDGVIAHFPDVDRTFHYLDMNKDGFITEMEFAIVWNSMSS